MARHVYFIFLSFALAAGNLSVRGVGEEESTTESETWSYYVTPSSLSVKSQYKAFFPDESTVYGLIKGNPTIQLLMEKARTRSGKLELRLLQWTDHMSSLALVDRQLREYVTHHEDFESDTLVDYAEWCVSRDSGAPDAILGRMHNLIVPMFTNQGLIDIVADFVTQDESGDVCDMQLSAHQVIYEIYNTLQATEAKGYAMMQFSWEILRIYDRGTYALERELARQEYLDRAEKTASSARIALAAAKRDLYKCSPASYDSDTYAEITRLLQGYIENEVDMNTDGTCKQDCPYYSYAENHGCFDDLFCSKQPRCAGTIRDCQFFDSDMWVCPASYHSNRRYQYIEYENGKILGRSGYCGLGTTKVDSWWRWLFWHCSYCMCLCDDDSYNSHRYFSLRPAVSNIDQNKVVTGVRFVKNGRVIHLQVYEGTLRERGLVESSEEVKVVEFDPSNAGVYENRDYHKLTYYSRSIDLHQLEAPTNYTLTGVRFQMIGSRLHFEIRSTPFNYTTGQLVPGLSEWISSDRSHASKYSLSLYKPDLPTRGDRTLYIDSSPNQYVEFTHSDFDADAAQSTVPFIDVQPVLPSKAYSKAASLNAGVGLYHRGASGSGGFIGIKLRTYDYSKHVKAEPPPEPHHKDVGKQFTK